MQRVPCADADACLPRNKIYLATF